MSSRLHPARYRWSVAARILAATVGGYTLTALLSIALALLFTAFGMNKAEAVLAVTIASFLIYAAIVMAVFHARSPARAWIGLTLAAIPAAAFSALAERTIPWVSLLTL